MRISDWSSDVCSSDLRPRPGLLKNNIRLLLQTAGNLERPGVIGGPIDVAGGNLAVENLVTVQKIIAAVNGGERLFLCSHHPAEGHRAFRGEEVSMLPTRLHTEAFARAITHLSRDGARRRTFQCDVQVNGFPVPVILRRQCHRRSQSRGDKGPAQVRDFRCRIRIARIEAGDELNMTCAEDIVVPDDYPTEAPIPARLHYHGKIALTVFMIYAHGRFVYFVKRIALFTHRDGQFQLRGDGLVGIDGESGRASWWERGCQYE